MIKQNAYTYTHIINSMVGNLIYAEVTRQHKHWESCIFCRREKQKEQAVFPLTVSICTLDWQKTVILFHRHFVAQLFEFARLGARVQNVSIPAEVSGAVASVQSSCDVAQEDSAKSLPWLLALLNIRKKNNWKQPSHQCRESEKPTSTGAGRKTGPFQPCAWVSSDLYCNQTVSTRTLQFWEINNLHQSELWVDIF